MAKELGGIPYVSTAVVLAAYPPGTAEQIPEGTGFVVPAGQATITACTWISRKWPNEAFGDRAVLRSFVGRAGDESALRFTDAELAAKVADDVEAAVGIGSPPVASRVVRWNRSMPQYQVGHLERIGRIEAALAKSPGVFVTGSAFRGVGIADCVREGRETAQGVVAYLRSGATDRAIGESPPGDLEQEAISWTS